MYGPALPTPSSSTTTIQLKFGRTWLRNTVERMNTADTQRQKVYNPVSTAKRSPNSSSTSPNQPRPRRGAPAAAAGNPQAVSASPSATHAASSSAEKATPPAAPL